MSISSLATICKWGLQASSWSKARFLTLSLHQESTTLVTPSSSSDAMVNKRKRDDLSDSDSDEIVPGRQILPVANLPYDFDQEPQDGMQYLFLVRYCLYFSMYSAGIHHVRRRDARQLPHVTRVRNPYEVSELKVAPTSTPLFTNVLPCEEWRLAFQTHFSNLRKVRVFRLI